MKSRKLIIKVLLSIALLIMVLNLSCFTLAAGGYHTVGIKPDKTVVAVGKNDYGQCDVGGWTNITAVFAGMSHTVALQGDGKVVATGRNDDGQCDVDDWTNVEWVAAGGWHTVGISEDLGVVAVGRNDYGQCDVEDWTMDPEGGLLIAAGGEHTVRLRANGEVVAVGRNDYGQCDVGGWTNIGGGAAGFSHTVGVKADGTVVAVGKNDEGQCNVGGWTNITRVAAGFSHTVGLKEDGTVVAVGRNDEGQCNVGGWTNIESVAAGGWHTVGLKDNGHVVATGDNSHGQCDVDDWILATSTLYPKQLTISSTAGGSVTTPGEGAFEYDAGSVVRLVAIEYSGYWFDKWTGDVETVADVGDAETTITMYLDYSITANFKGGDGPCGCFIATAAYGTPMAEEIEILREFRDGYMLTNPVGQALVDLYYRVSPPMADFISEHPSLKPIVRAGLLPAVAMSAIAVNTSPAEKMVIVGLVALVSVALAVWATRRRGRGPLYA